MLINMNNNSPKGEIIVAIVMAVLMFTVVTSFNFYLKG